MKRVAVVLSVIVVLCALVCGFVGSAVALDITRPSVEHSTATVNFVVNQGDSTAVVAANLEKAGLVRNAALFRLLARYRHLDRGIEPGVYKLSPSMTSDTIIKVLQNAAPDQLVVLIAPGLRVTQYPNRLKTLPKFDPQSFLKAAQTGVLPDGTQLWQSYWYVEKPQKNAAYALEGYLYPDTYFFDPQDTESAAIKRMLDNLGAHLCPGPSTNPDQYIHDQAACKANAVKINGTSIFTLMEQHYFTQDDTLALYNVLTMGGLVVREIDNPDDGGDVASVYYNRYLVSQNKLASPPGDFVGNMGSDPSAEYARDTDNPPTDGKWWADLGDAGVNVHPNSPYNTEVSQHPGLPPGPIAAPIMAEILVAINPPQSPYLYFIGDKCGIHRAKTFAEFQKIQAVPCNK